MRHNQWPGHSDWLTCLIYTFIVYNYNHQVNLYTLSYYYYSSTTLASPMNFASFSGSLTKGLGIEILMRGYWTFKWLYLGASSFKTEI